MKLYVGELSAYLPEVIPKNGGSNPADHATLMDNFDKLCDPFVPCFQN
jgi:hypothetical protein